MTAVVARCSSPFAVIAALAHPYGKFSLGGLGMKLSGNSSNNAGYDLFPLEKLLNSLGGHLSATTVPRIDAPRSEIMPQAM